MDNNKLWEVERLRTTTANGKAAVHAYGIIYSKTINPNTRLRDDDWIMTQVKACDVFRDISSNQLCFYSIKPVDFVTVVDGKLKTIKI